MYRSQFRLPDDVIGWLKEQARIEQRSLNSQLVISLQRQREQQANKKGPSGGNR